MVLLDLIEKAINEHGSAAIMKERLELIREQVRTGKEINYACGRKQYSETNGHAA